MSQQDLIRWAGQNQIELYLTSARDLFELPLFLTTGHHEPVYYYRVQFRLIARHWADLPDFRAEQAFWVRHYQEQVTAGNIHLQARLVDYQRERELASQMKISLGDILPVTVQIASHKSIPGCLFIEQACHNGVFSGMLYVLGEPVLSHCAIRRIVRWNEVGEEKIIDCEIAEILQLKRK